MTRNSDLPHAVSDWSPEFDPDRQLLELISWQFVAELLRRHPHSFELIEAHPSGGHSDCLGLCTNRDGLIAAFNRPGSMAVFGISANSDPGTMSDLWTQLVRYDADQSVIMQKAERLLGLASPSALPKSTRKVLTFRVMARFLRLAAFSLDVREWRNGFLDTSGFGGGPRSTWFDQFPQLRERLLVKEEHDVMNLPEYRFWFLSDALWGDTETPLVCVETTGYIHYRDGTSKDLMAIYKANARDLNTTMLNTMSRFAPKR